jgi:hypothetical protein
MARRRKMHREMQETEGASDASLDNGKEEGEAPGNANRGGRRHASGDTSLDNGKEEGDLRQATINRGGRRHALGDASLDNGKEEGDASGNASNAPPG